MAYSAHSQQHTNRRMPVEDSTQEPSKKKGLFEDLSIPQVTAGALAAVTSMLLSSQIGVAGSVIGVAVGSVVATVTSQIYKRFLSLSADKIHDLHDQHTSSSDSLGGQADYQLSAEPERAPQGRTSSDATSRMTGSFVNESTLSSDGDATRVIGRHHSSLDSDRPGVQSAHRQTVGDPTSVMADDATMQSSATHAMTGVQGAHHAGAHSRTPRINDEQAHIGSDLLSQRAAQRKKSELQKRAIIVSVISALVAVGLSAFIINVATTGQGIGTKTPPLVTTDTSTTASDQSSSNGTTSTQGATTTAQGQNAPDANQDSASSNDSTQSGTGSSDNSSSNSTTPSTSGSQSSQSGESTSSTSGSQTGQEGSSSSGSGTSTNGSSTSGSGTSSGSSTGSSTNGSSSDSQSGSTNKNSQSQESTSGTSGTSTEGSNTTTTQSAA
ncbi:MAG: hypothetical protein LKF76_07040 [Eggerthellaceae bacterium]|nr:hypothetical protein [Eggerthellaceae bacterium]